jgi:hypothetical protein
VGVPSADVSNAGLRDCLVGLGGKQTNRRKYQSCNYKTATNPHIS